MLAIYKRMSQGNSKDTQVLKFEEFAKIVAHVPQASDEQAAVAAVFDDLDSLITLHQCKHVLCYVYFFFNG